MFIQLAHALKVTQSTSTSPNDVSYSLFDLHPLQVQTTMDVVWEYARRRSEPLAIQINDSAIGAPDPVPLLNPVNISLRDQLLRVLHPQGAFGGVGSEVLVRTMRNMLDAIDAEIVTPGNLSPAKPPRLWHNLIYAYMVENTQAISIFARVLQEIFHGERLGAISESGQRWARVTEQLFFQNTGFSFISALQSSLRPDSGATRRNAYHRMFALDLNHGTDDNRSYPYVKSEANNREFVATLESFLSEVWRGYTNATNSAGAKDTDDSTIADLARKLEEMLGERRLKGNLTREEFVAVATASWFHLVLSTPDAPIVVDLRAEAKTPEERLRRVAERVGMTPHSKSRSLLLMAEPLSALLTEIERGTYSEVSNVAALYDPTLTPNVTNDTLLIINQWEKATGRNLKSMPVTHAR